MVDEGTVYLIHLDEPIAGRSRHYIGWALNVEGRLKHHKNGTGARFLAEANRLGISYTIVRTWKGNKHEERRLKNYKKSRQLCPICKKKH